MTISLTPDVERFLQSKVATGEFPSIHDAANALLARAKEEELLSAGEIEELREEIDVGIADAAAGRFEDFTAESVIAEQRAKMRR
jgi:antitoxin ParD1/3/4